MKKNLLPLLSVLGVMMLASCASPIAKRIERNPQAYAALSPVNQRLVATGQIAEGLSKEAVFIAWGRPNRKSNGSSNGRRTERWSYAGYDTVHGTSLGLGYSYGYWSDPYYYGPSLYYQPSVTYVPYERKWVEFTKNRVSAYSVGP